MICTCTLYDRIEVIFNREENEVVLNGLQLVSKGELVRNQYGNHLLWIYIIISAIIQSNTDLVWYSWSEHT